MRKRIICLFLTMVMCSCCACGNSNVDTSNENSSVSKVESVDSSASDVVFDNYHEARAYLEDAIWNYEDEISIYTTKNIDNSFIDDVLNIYELTILMSSPYEQVETENYYRWDIDFIYRCYKDDLEPLNNIIQSIISNAEFNENEADEIRKIAINVSDFLEYEKENNALKGILNKKGDCDSYTGLFCLCASQLSIEARYLEFSLEDTHITHVLNVVKCGSSWYYVDCTAIDTSGDSPDKYILFGQDFINSHPDYKKMTLLDKFRNYYNIDLSETHY